MFVQVIRGKAKDAEAVRAANDGWVKELKPGAKGYLGSTGGVSPKGEFILAARFESEEAAKANSKRPEQSAWWEQNMSKTFDGQPTFYDCPTVDVMMGGGSDTAGFVQFMVMKVNDVDKMRALGKEMENIPMNRDDMIGAVDAYTKDGTCVSILYFTSEAEARIGEKKEPTPEMKEMMEKYEGLTEGETEFIDVLDPWFDSA